METLENKKTITDNLELLKWYLNKDENRSQFDPENEKEELFYFLSICLYEDPFVFFRILLYVANTRTSTSEEIIYKQMLHFLSVLAPQYLLANMDLLIKFGYKNDILILLTASNIRNRVIKFITHLSKTDDDFKTLLNGKLIEKNRNTIIKYKEKSPLQIDKYINNIDDNSEIIELLENILDDPNLNGISMPNIN